MVRSLRSVESQDALLGAEGNAARVYFSAFSDMLTPRELPGGTFEFRGRNRRPPKDPVNALLSFVYGLIVRDLVGAITGESHLEGRDIGAIQIFEKFSLVEVPAGSADDVISAMRATTIRGRKASIRRDRGRND